MNNIKKDFPIFTNQPNLIYLDSAATSQKPQITINALSQYYDSMNSNIGRGVYDLARISEESYIKSKKTIANFICCKSKNIVYTLGCTESLNLAAHIIKQKIKKKYIVLPISEHHANILVWQRISKEMNKEIYWVSNPEEINNPNLIPEEILQNTCVFSLAHVTNVTGEAYPVKKWCELAKKLGAISVIDGAQSITSIKINVLDIDCDFYAFSSHKIYGPMGLGVLYIKDKMIDSQPLILGGGIIEDVTTLDYELLEDISKFESGTPNVANAFSFSKTLEYLSSNNWDNLIENTHKIGTYLEESISNIGLEPISIGKEFSKTHITSFVIPNVHAHDVGTFLSLKNIAVRVGKHCTHPLHSHLKINSSIRASIGIYNNKEDIDQLINGLKECIQYFKR